MPVEIKDLASYQVDFNPEEEVIPPGSPVASLRIRYPFFDTTATNKDALSRDLADYYPLVRNFLTRFMFIKSSLRQMTVFARKKFIELALPHPGIAQIGDDFYTGWFKIQTESGINTLFASRLVGMPHYDGAFVNNPKPSTYLYLPKDAGFLNEKAQNLPERLKYTLIILKIKTVNV